MSQSILGATKLALGIPEEHTAFDAEITMYINSAIADLAQIGLPGAKNFEVLNADEVWSDLLGTNTGLNMVKGYIRNRVKLKFDPPEIGFVLTALKEEIAKDEWRIQVEADVPTAPVVTVTEEV